MTPRLAYQAQSWHDFHRITECFGLDGTFRGHLAQPPCSEQGHLQPDRVAQSPVRPGLGCSQGWDLHHLSGQPGPGFHCPHCKKFLPCIQFNLPIFSLKPLPLVLPQQALLEFTHEIMVLLVPLYFATILCTKAAAGVTACQAHFQLLLSLSSL